MSHDVQIMTEDTVFEQGDDETLLDTLERTSHQIENQCRYFNCGLLRCL